MSCVLRRDADTPGIRKPPVRAAARIEIPGAGGEKQYQVPREYLAPTMSLIARFAIAVKSTGDLFWIYHAKFAPATANANICDVSPTRWAGHSGITRDWNSRHGGWECGGGLKSRSSRTPLNFKWRSRDQVGADNDMFIRKCRASWSKQGQEPPLGPDHAPSSLA